MGFDNTYLVAYNYSSFNSLESINLAKGTDYNIGKKNQAAEMEHLKKRLDMFDRRLDNIDSMVTAVAERVMKQPITLNIICPHCGRDIEIGILGNEKPRR